MSNIISGKTSVFHGLETACDVVIGGYSKGGLYIGLNAKNGELLDDISTNVFPCFPGTFFVLRNSKAETFCKEQEQLFSCTGETVKKNFNTYILYEFIKQ